MEALDPGDTRITIDLAAAGKERGIRDFLISLVDLFGVMRAKLVRASAIGGMARAGAGFAGFSTWMDMTPADADMPAIPDPDSLIQLPWKPEVGWLAADLRMAGQPVAQAPRVVLKRQIVAAVAQGLTMKTGVECEFPVGNRHPCDRGCRRPGGEILLRPRGAGAALRRHQRDL